MTNLLLLLCLILTFLAPWGFAAKRHKKSFAKSSKRLPNIIFILTDDLDNELGSPLVLNKTRKLIMEGGAEFVNSFVTTPMCCPSRSSILTGTYVHNNHIFTNNNNCSGPSWRKGPETRTFGKYLHDAGYVTGYFGKYLNDYEGKYIPPGWKRWFGLIKNSRYYNYHVNNNGTLEYHRNFYSKDYLTDLIANKSTTFFRKSKTSKPNRPVMMMLSLPAPHGPEDGAPQYVDRFPNVTVPRTPHWNINSPDKHWIIRNTFPMDEQKIAFQDLLYRKRLQTLLSVDDVVERVFKVVKGLGLLHETYIIFSSDHGYHLGQFGLVKGKSMPYEMDIKVPFYIRGPGIPKNIKMTEIIANIDWAPTLLDMAKAPIPPHMDGLSFMTLFNSGLRKSRRRKQPVVWRDTIIIERGKPWKSGRRNNSSDQTLKSARRKVDDDRYQLVRVCSLPVYRSPCRPGQHWECKTVNSRPRFKKCKVEQAPTTPPMPQIKQVCTCYRKRKMSGFDTYTVIKDLPLSRIDRQSTDSRDVDRGSGSEMEPENYYKTPYVQDNRVTTDVKIRSGRNKKRRNSKSHSARKSQSYSKKTSYTERMMQSSKETLPDLIGIRLIRLKAKIADTRLRLENLRERRKRLVHAVNVQPEEFCQCRNETIYPQEKRKKNKPISRVRISDNHKMHPLLRIKNEGKSKKGKGKTKSKRGGVCNTPGLNCFRQTNDHWKVPPLWTGGEFCFCPNTNNNTYFCLRTVNKTHNFLYCEFITNFTEYFDINKDPYQLHNTVDSLPQDIRNKLHNTLEYLQGCQGQERCYFSQGKIPLTKILTQPSESRNNTKRTGGSKLTPTESPHFTASSFEKDTSRDMGTLHEGRTPSVQPGTDNTIKLEDLEILETTRQPSESRK